MDLAASKGNRKLGENRSKLERGLMRYLIWLTLASCAATNLRLKCLSPCSASVNLLQAKAGASEQNPRTATLAKSTQGCLQMQSPPLGSVETRSHHALPKEPKISQSFDLKIFK